MRAPARLSARRAVALAAGVLLSGCASANCAAIACTSTVTFQQRHYQDTGTVLAQDVVRQDRAGTVQACVHRECSEQLRVRLGAIRGVDPSTALAIHDDGHWHRVDAQPPAADR